MSRQYRQPEPSSSWQEPRFMPCLHHIEIQQYQEDKKKKKERARRRNSWILMNPFGIKQYMVMRGQASKAGSDVRVPDESPQGVLWFWCRRASVQLLLVISPPCHSATAFSGNFTGHTVCVRACARCWRFRSE